MDEGGDGSRLAVDPADHFDRGPDGDVLVSLPEGAEGDADLVHVEQRVPLRVRGRRHLVVGAVAPEEEPLPLALEVEGEVAGFGADVVSAGMVDTAQAALPEWANRPVVQRCQFLFKFRELLVEQGGHLPHGEPAFGAQPFATAFQAIIVTELADLGRVEAASG